MARSLKKGPFADKDLMKKVKKVIKIVIPQENSTQYPISTTGKYFYPEIPASFDAAERENATIGLVSENQGIPASEQVSAGVGYPGDPAKYAKTIELEYGAALKGVHRLVDGETRLYDNAISHLTVGRDEWTLVGTIVKPADGNGGYRFITSNDYFCNYTPQVYMHRAEIVQEGEFVNATWGDTFADLDKGWYTFNDVKGHWAEVTETKIANNTFVCDEDAYLLLPIQMHISLRRMIGLQMESFSAQ